MSKNDKIRCFNQDNSHFAAFERHAKLAASELSGVHWKEWVTSSFPYLNPLMNGDAMLEK